MSVEFLSAGHELKRLLPEDFLEEGLKHHFGFNAFRPQQREIVQSLLEKKDVLAILPTGAGKSLCYQLPALLQTGTAVVISPLISLMQDQVVSLYNSGISAAFITSSLSCKEIESVLQNISDYKLIYVAPERFADLRFLECLKETKISFFVVDEAHCISQWGHSFRLEYRKLSFLKKTFPQCPVIAVTATATEDVEKDILTQLSMQNPTIIKGSFDRPNLTIKIHSKIQTDKQLLEFLKNQKNSSGIIYSATRKGVDQVFAQLEKAGFSVRRYHAGMPEKERSASQHAFLHEQVEIMVATVAFGMGVHKSNIRFIIHLDMPGSIEQYYQEIGRAGRDGLPSECLMLFGVQDVIVRKSFLEEIEDSLIRQQAHKKLDSMYRFCTTLKCRRRELLRYFGEVFSKESCDSCDNCMKESELVEATTEAKKILSCVFRLGQNVGIRMTIDVLRGSKNLNILKRGFEKLSTYGLLRSLSDPEVRYYIDSLLHLNLLKVTEGEYPVLKWTEASSKVVYREEKVFFKKRIFKKSTYVHEMNQEKLKENERKPILTGFEKNTLIFDEPLFDALKKLRLEIARQDHVPPYVVFSDRALQEMAVHFPRSEKEFLRINGVGPIKWIKYGKKFLDAIQEAVEKS